MASYDYVNFDLTTTDFVTTSWSGVTFVDSVAVVTDLGLEPCRELCAVPKTEVLWD